MITKITCRYSFEVLDFHCNDFGFTFNIGVSYLGIYKTVLRHLCPRHLCPPTYVPFRHMCPFDICALSTYVPTRHLCPATLVPNDTCAHRHLFPRHLCPRHLCPRHLCRQHLCPRQYCVHCIIFFCYQSTHNATVCLPFVCCILFQKS